MFKRIFIFFICFILPVTYSFGQKKLKHRKNSRPYEIVGGFGATNFLGELGGQKDIGKNGIRDLDFLATRPLFNLGVRYNTCEFAAARANFFYGRLLGKDKYTTNPARNYRNLSFKSPIIELSTQVEFSFIREKSDNVYILPDAVKEFITKLKGKFGKAQQGEGGQNNDDIAPISFYPYAFLGIGGFYFNPKAKYNDKWYALQKLGTEGQGIEPGMKKYRRVSICIPMGLGLKYKYNKKIALGFEYGLRKTFTDYVDDVSTKYYDKGKLRSQYGEASAALSDPSDGSKPGNTIAGEQRGDSKDKDWYMFLNLTVSYKLETIKQRIRPKY